MTKHDNFVMWTARTLYYDMMRCVPYALDLLWDGAKEETKDEIQRVANQYAQDFALESPKTYRWLLDNTRGFK